MAPLRQLSDLGPLRDELDLDDFPRSVSPEITSSLIRLVTRVEAMGLLAPLGTIDSNQVEKALQALDTEGIGVAVATIAQFAADPKRAIEALLRAVEHSPVPRPTLRHLTELIGVETAASLVGISVASARRYLSGTRPVPDDVAFRLHVVAMIVADLAGSYNAYGIRRWFTRNRSPLGGRSPAAILAGAWDPDDGEVIRLRELASALTAPLAS